MVSKPVLIGIVASMAIFIVVGVSVFCIMRGNEEHLVELGGLKNHVSDLESEVRLLTSELETLRYSTGAPVVIRLDDIQDFAFREAQLRILGHNTARGIPTSMAIIPMLFGSDEELVREVKSALEAGSEAAAHGWEHEDLSALTAKEQERILSYAKVTLSKTLGIDVSVLVPPMFAFNADTISSMKEIGYELISSSLDLQKPGAGTDGIVYVPGTVEFSDFKEGKWVKKSVEALREEVAASIRSYGYAMIVIHPQEFMEEDQFDATTFEKYDQLIDILSQSCSFTTIQELGKRITDSD